MDQRGQARLRTNPPSTVNCITLFQQGSVTLDDTVTSTSPRQAARPRDAATPSAAPSLWNAETAPHAAIWPGLPDTAPASAIRDSLYDLIPLGPLELDLLATPAFTRLQGIKQLGFVYRVWPGATHTRFEHSLGVYYLMLRGLRALLAHDATRARHRGPDRA